MIYFIQAASGPFKVGYSHNGPAQRLGSLQTQTHEVLTLIGVIEGDQQDERRVHKMLAPHRIRGEWFRSCYEINQLMVDGVEATLMARGGYKRSDMCPVRISRKMRDKVRRLADMDGRTLTNQIEWMIDKAMAKEVVDLKRRGLYVPEREERAK